MSREGFKGRLKPEGTKGLGQAYSTCGVECALYTLPRLRMSRRCLEPLCRGYQPLNLVGSCGGGVGFHCDAGVFFGIFPVAVKIDHGGDPWWWRGARKKEIP